MPDIKEFLTQETIKRLRNVNSGMCTLLDPETPDEFREQHRWIEITEPRKLIADDLELLCQLLLDPNSWHRCRKRAPGRQCHLQPRIQLWNGEAPDRCSLVSLECTGTT